MLGVLTETGIARGFFSKLFQWKDIEKSGSLSFIKSIS